jgi:hypothetical protein
MYLRSFDISGSHGSDCEDDNLLGYSAVYSSRSWPTFKRCLLPPPSGRLSSQTTAHV